jgi:hypothetical protein
MKYLFSDECFNYDLIDKYFIKNERVEIRYGKHTVKRHYIINFIILERMRYSWYIK